MIKLRTINKEVVKPIDVSNGLDPKKIRGYDLFSEPYGNIFICAKKKSGKSQVINKILQKCVGRDTKVYAFVGTLYKDPVWKHIMKQFKHRGIEFEGHTSFKEDGVDILKELIDELKEDVIDSEEEEERLPKPKALIRVDDDDEDRPKRKEKLLAPEIIFVMDDLSGELKSKTLVALLKLHRHFKAKIIVSSQYPYDLLPESRVQMDYVLLFKGHPADKLMAIWKDCDLSMEYPLFEKLYHSATEKPYSFLYISAREERFRRNFNKVYDIYEMKKEYERLRYETEFEDYSDSDEE